jgi:hypothetical protein
MIAGMEDTTRIRYLELEALPKGTVQGIETAAVLVIDPTTTGAAKLPLASDISAVYTLPATAGPPAMVNWTVNVCPEQNGPPLMFLVVMDVNANAPRLSIEARKRSKVFFMKLKALFDAIYETLKLDTTIFRKPLHFGGRCCYP